MSEISPTGMQGAGRQGAGRQALWRRIDPARLERAIAQFDPEFLSYLGSRWKLERAQTIHGAEAAASSLAAAPDTGNGVRQSQDAAIEASQSTDKRKDPVRNVGKKVGRNDPCPCGSGKKFKACCMRKESSVDTF